jgi:hypothetical protein
MFVTLNNREQTPVVEDSIRYPLPLTLEGVLFKS